MPLAQFPRGPEPAITSYSFKISKCHLHSKLVLLSMDDDYGIAHDAGRRGYAVKRQMRGDVEHQFALPLGFAMRAEQRADYGDAPEDRDPLLGVRDARLDK